MVELRADTPTPRHGRVGIAVLVALLASACMSVGPRTVPSDQVDYADATSYIVASQVVAGYQLQANVSVNADLDTNNGWSLSDSTGVSVGGQFNNSPTITYTPVAGADFAALLLQPVTPTDLYALIAGGTPPDLVLGLLLGQINGLRNDLIERPGATASDEQFREFLNLMLALHAAGAFHFRIEGEGKARRAFLSVPRAGVALGVAREAAQFLELLGLDPAHEEYPIPYGAGSGAPDSIVLLTRSIAEILRDLASLIDVPPEDVATGRTYPSYTAAEVDLRRVRIHARVGDYPPLFEDVYVAASYRGRWFWIEDADFPSKQVFSFLVDLLQLAQTTGAQSLPVITIPSG